MIQWFLVLQVYQGMVVPEIRPSGYYYSTQYACATKGDEILQLNINNKLDGIRMIQGYECWKAEAEKMP